MRRAAAVGLALLAAPACAAPEEAEVGSDEQAIIGGTLSAADDSVVMLSIGCTGTMVAPNVVLTAAHCLPMVGGAVYYGGGELNGGFFANRPVVEEFMARAYGAGIFAGDDVALLRLGSDGPPEAPPLPMNRRALTQDDVGADIRTVGYGRTSGTGSDYGTKRYVVHQILGIDEQFVGFGTPTANTCQGDSGGPTFMQIDGVEQVIAVTSFGASGCEGYSRVDRTDIFMDVFIDEVIAAWSGPCRLDGTCVTDGCGSYPDPDCAPCGVDGICSTGCAKKDLDCPLGADVGEVCDDREDCESLLCVPGLDDPRVHYCSADCTDTGTCPVPLTLCQPYEGGDACFYEGISPSAQGSACQNGGECRSGICDPDDLICVEQCGDGQPECADGYECSALGDLQLCRLPADGGCRLDRAGRGGGAGWLLLGLLAFLVARLPKRRRS